VNRFRKIGVVGASSLALLAGGGYALAADSGNSSSDQSASSAGSAQRPKFDPQRASKDRDQFYTDLGKKLGKSQDEVKAAFRALLSDKLDEQVKAGQLTDAQKDAILQGFDAGLPGGPFGGPGGPGGPGHGPGGPAPGGPGGGMGVVVPAPEAGQ
jgi:hypothetical protein